MWLAGAALYLRSYSTEISYDLTREGVGFGFQRSTFGRAVLGRFQGTREGSSCLIPARLLALPLGPGGRKGPQGKWPRELQAVEESIGGKDMAAARGSLDWDPE